MKKYYIKKGEMPPANTYILAHLACSYGTLPQWAVVYCQYGITQKERELLKKQNNPRANLYCGADEYGNNKVPYKFYAGVSQYFGQDIDYWCELPT